MLRALCLVFCILTVLGLLASIVVHVSTLRGVNPTDEYPLLNEFDLGLALFVVVPGAVLLSIRTSPAKDHNPWGDTPGWLLGVALCFFAYGMVIGIVRCTQYEGVAAVRPEDGTYYLHEHSRFIRDITAEEYHVYQVRQWRINTASWMTFYGMTLTMILPRVWARVARTSKEASPPAAEGL